MLRWLAEVVAWLFRDNDSVLDEQILVYREERDIKVEELHERKVA